MRIAQLAPLWKTVPPAKYGGSELIVSLLTEQLAKNGHEVTLFACGGSKTGAHLKQIIDRPLYDILGKFDFSAIPFQDFLSIHEAFDMALKGRVDIIHNHMGFHVASLADTLPIPMVTTNHSSLPPDFPELAVEARHSNYVSISNAQRKTAPYLNYINTVYHGIDVKSYDFCDTPEDYLLFFATMWNEKGVDRAVKIARETKMKLIMAGDIRRQSDFDAVKPFIDGKNISFLGEVDFKAKNKLFKYAKAYLFPIRWNEAFGLTVVESLACGTPVIAWPNGSLPEIIEHGKTGFLVKSVDEAVSAIKNVDKISRQDCRDTAIKRFDAKVMADQYVEVYRRLIK